MSQTAAWFTETTSVSEEVRQHVCKPTALKSLLLHHRHLGTLSSGEFNRNGVNLFRWNDSQFCSSINISLTDESWKTCLLFISCCYVHSSFLVFCLLQKDLTSIPTFWGVKCFPFTITAPTSNGEDIIFSTLALAPQTGVGKLTEPYCEDDAYDSEEETMALEELEEADRSESSDVTTDNWLPKKKSG